MKKYFYGLIVSLLGTSVALAECGYGLRNDPKRPRVVCVDGVVRTVAREAPSLRVVTRTQVAVQEAVQGRTADRGLVDEPSDETVVHIEVKNGTTLFVHIEGPAKVLLSQEFDLRDRETSRRVLVIEPARGGKYIYWYRGMDLTVEGVTLRGLSQKDRKFRDDHDGKVYALEKGDPLPPGEGVEIHGTFSWKKDDVVYFHEDGRKEKRVWKWVGPLVR